MADVLPWVLIVASSLTALLLTVVLARTLWGLVARVRANGADELAAAAADAGEED